MSLSVPGELWLAESYLSSIDVEGGRDDLASVASFQRWLGEHGQQAAAETADDDDLHLARELREELREVLKAHADGHPGGSPRLDALAATIPLRARFVGGGVDLAPKCDGVSAVLGEVLAAIVIADREGTWHRLKLCREGSCQVVFFDRSKNASRCWCSMQVCGNRNKTRAYRGRQRSTG